MRVLVLGAYGLIGEGIVRRLRAEGIAHRGLVRSRKKAQKLLPGLDCIEADIGKLVHAHDWQTILKDTDVVINASGALQDSLQDKLDAVQDRSIRALIEACEEAGVKTFIQISAPGAEANADTAFMSTKGKADEALRKSKLNWVIYKPGLVISPNAYGGTALIRMLAGSPYFVPLILPDVRIQTVAIDDVAGAVFAALSGSIPMQCDYDLVEDKPHKLGEIVVSFRKWMGYGDDAPKFILPSWLGRGFAVIADAAGWLGWRSSLRSTALRVLEKDVKGDPAPWRDASGGNVKSLKETLQSMPATMQERVFARTQFFFPIAVVTLSAFFILTGVIGLFQLDRAAALLSTDLSNEATKRLAGGGALLDIALGCALLVRKWTAPAAIAMMALSFFYLVFGTLLTPGLWGDPLGSMLKIFPVIVLAAAVWILAVER